MRAVAVARFRETPTLMELPRPVPGAGEVLVRVRYAGVNPFDLKIADGILDGSRPHVFPLVLGVDAAGTVEEVGSGAGRFQVGDQILGQFLHNPVGTGTYAEWAPVPENIGVGTVPVGMPLDQAAALPTAGMTALAALEMLALPSGADLVIVGASGGVGSFATALAASRGLRVVAVARASSAARLRSLGADEVVDPSSGDAKDAVRQAHRSGVDGLLDVMSDAKAFAEWTTLVRRGGAAATSVYVANADTLAREGLRGGNLDLQPSAALLARLFRAVVEGHLPVPLERRISLTEAAGVLAEMKAGRASGKTVIDLGS
jgi:NADPH:quinone reductase